MKKIIISIFRLLPKNIQKPLADFAYKYYHLIQFNNLKHRRKNLKKLNQILSENPHKKVIIYPPIIDWSWMKQRPHHLMNGLAKAGYLVFFCTPNLRQDRVDGFLKIEKNLYLCSDISILAKKITSPIFFTSSVEHNQWIKKMNQPTIVYDYLDDLNVYIGGSDHKKITMHEYLIDNSDLIITTADSLAKQISKKTNKYLQAPNAAEYTHFVKGKFKLPNDLKKYADKKIIGYYGALAKWFDFKLLFEVSKSKQDYIFVLIGPDFDGVIKKYNLKKYSNIVWLGLKKYEDLPHYLHHFDVAILPFIKNNITDAVSPVKIFEYMSGGIPIVTTDLNECKKYKSVLISKNSRDFIKSIDKALKLKKDKKYLKLLKKEAKDNSWQKRVDLIKKHLEKIV